MKKKADISKKKIEYRIDFRINLDKIRKKDEKEYFSLLSFYLH